jgi:fluoride ion exporter CrcB/FEX
MYERASFLLPVLTVVLNALGEFLLQAFVHVLDTSWSRLPKPTLFVPHGFLACSFLAKEVSTVIDKWGRGYIIIVILSMVYGTVSSSAHVMVEWWAGNR